MCFRPQTFSWRSGRARVGHGTSLAIFVCSYTCFSPGPAGRWLLGPASWAAVTYVRQLEYQNSEVSRIWTPGVNMKPARPKGRAPAAVIYSQARSYVNSRTWQAGLNRGSTVVRVLWCLCVSFSARICNGAVLVGRRVSPGSENHRRRCQTLRQMPRSTSMPTPTDLFHADICFYLWLCVW